MALLMTSTSQEVYASASTGAIGAAWTLSAWNKKDAGSAIQSNNIDETLATGMHMNWLNDGRVSVGIGDGTTLRHGSVTGVTSNTTTQFHHFCVVFDGNLSGDANRLKCYVNGSQQTISWEATGVPATSPNFPVFRFNRSIRDTNIRSGVYAEGALWDVALTAAEITSLSKGFKPHRIRPNNMLWYVPMIRAAHSVSGAAFTSAGSPAQSSHPRMV